MTSKQYKAVFTLIWKCSAIFGGGSDSSVMVIDTILYLYRTTRPRRVGEILVTLTLAHSSREQLASPTATPSQDQPSDDMKIYYTLQRISLLQILAIGLFLFCRSP